MEVREVVGAADLTVHPLYDLFKDRFGLYVVSAGEFLRADLAGAAEAASLGNRRAERGDPARTHGAPLVEVEVEPAEAEHRRAHVRAERAERAEVQGRGGAPPPPYTARAAATSWAAPVT